MIQFISFTIKEGLEGIKANKEACMVAIATISVSMTIFGILLIVFFNLQGMANKWKEKFQIVVYVKNNIKKNDLNLLKTYFKSSNEIEKYFYISKNEAMIKFRKRLNDKQAILDSLETNPLPASFELKLKKESHSYDHLKAIAEEAAKLNGVENVEFGEEWLERLETALYFFEFLVFVIGGLICVGIIFIVSNTIKLSLFSRKSEIEIMQLVGARDWYIRGPFLLEGIFQGFFGAILSIIILYGLYQAFIANLKTSAFFIGFHSFLFIPQKAIFYMILSGVLIGYSGSFISLNRFLNK